MLHRDRSDRINIQKLLGLFDHSRFGAAFEPKLGIHQVHFLLENHTVVADPHNGAESITDRHAGRRHAAVLNLSRVGALAAMVDEALRRSRSLHITSTAEGADAVMLGTIKAFTLRPVLLDVLGRARLFEVSHVPEVQKVETPVRDH